MSNKTKSVKSNNSGSKSKSIHKTKTKIRTSIKNGNNRNKSTMTTFKKKVGKMKGKANGKGRGPSGQPSKKLINPFSPSSKEKKSYRYGLEFDRMANDRIKTNHREIQCLKEVFKTLQTEHASLNGKLDRIQREKNPNGMMETHRMEAYLQSLQSYMTVIHGKDPLVDRMRQCKYFHYIGMDHSVMKVENSSLDRLQKELEKKKAMIEKMMNKDPSLLKDLVS